MTFMRLMVSPLVLGVNRERERERERGGERGRERGRERDSCTVVLLLLYSYYWSWSIGVFSLGEPGGEG